MIYSIIGLLFFVIVLLLNAKFKFLNKINKLMCYVLCIAFLAVAGILTYNGYVEGIGNKEQLYLAVHYLKDMDYDNATLKLRNLKSDNKKSFVHIAANAIIGNKTNNSSLYLLNMKLAEKQYGNKDREKELIDYINSNIDNDEKFITICSNLADILNLDDKIQNKLNDYYLLESQLASDNNEGKNDILKGIKDFKTDYKDTDDLYQKLIINYYLSSGDYNKALEECKSMLEENDSKEIRYAIAEIVSNMAYENQDIDIVEQESSKKQKEQKNKKNDKLKESLAKAIEKEQLEINEEKKVQLQKEVEKLQNEIEENNKKINNSNVYKTLSFISKYNDKDAKVLKAKLFYSIGEVEKAKDMLMHLAETEDSLFENVSSTKLAEAYAVSENKFNNVIAEEATKDTLIASDSIVFAGNTLLISDLEKFIINDIKYNSSSISITSIDYSQYPIMKLNLDVDKLNEINLNSETFQVKDTGYEVKYTVEIDEAEGNVVFVVDKSGSMDGQPIADVKEALANSIEGMDDVRISVVEYNSGGYLTCDLTSDKNTVKSAVDGIQTGGGTNIAAGLAVGIDVLLDEPGSRTIILMTDGQGSGDIDYEIKRAIENNVVIHTIGYGDQADEVLKYIAEESYGEYLITSNSSEIVYIYGLIKKYIGNNVSITYEVVDNKEQLDRYVFVKLIEGNKTDKKSYMLNNEESEVNEELVMVNSIKPNGFDAQYLENRQYSSYISGRNLDKMSKAVLNSIEVEFTVRNNESIMINIPENLPAGIYDLMLYDDNGDEFVIKYAIAVGERINQNVLKLGNVEINSNMILLTTDNKYVCTGNNILNSIFTSQFNLVAEPDNVTINEENATVDFGDNGKVYGDGQLILDINLYRRNINTKYNSYDNIIVRNGMFEFDCNDILSKNIDADLGGAR